MLYKRSMCETLVTCGTLDVGKLGYEGRSCRRINDTGPPRYRGPNTCRKAPPPPYDEHPQRGTPIQFQ
ncbi:hypothetical protein TNCV_3494621 [Trichonephila clavipes]|nr:hypothetical protein TNCV_3494621 [Trichonephila clavipes]